MTPFARTIPHDYEQPLPMLEVDTPALAIETKERHEGRLTVRNIGGGVLEGYVCGGHRSLQFTPAQWVGNTQELSYTFDPALADGLAPGQTFECMVYICTNGGEAELPVSVRLTKMAITTREGVTLANLDDFFDYAMGYPAQARQVFMGSEFYMLLMALGYPYMKVYESLLEDANRERALDNFLVLSGLKPRTGLALVKHTHVFDAISHTPDKLHGQLIAQKTDAGYFEAPITAPVVPWLALSANRLIAGDFDAHNRAAINFSIDPTQVPGRYARALVHIGPQPDPTTTAEIIFRRPRPLTVRLARDTFRYEDTGTIMIYNHTGHELMLELFCPESYVRFEARRYVVGAFYEVPFGIKLSALMAAGRLFRKAAYMRTSIEVKGSCAGHVYKFNLPVTVGEW